LEHVHPDELPLMLDMIDRVLVSGGMMVMHAGQCADHLPMHFDNGPVIWEWLERGYEWKSEALWYRK
jgi:hypothetical protein